MNASTRADDCKPLHLRAAMERFRHARREGTLLDAYRDRAPDFHDLIAEAAGSERLRELLRGDLFYLIRRYRYRATLSDGRAAHGRREHEAIVHAIERRDAEQAELLMREHLRRSHEIILQQADAAE